jgi:type III secretion system chaperone SycN
MGLPELSLKDGKAQLRIQDMGTLFIEESKEEILVYLARDFPPYDREVPRRALALCRPGSARPFTVYAGLYKSSTLVLLTRFLKKNFSLQSLEQTVPALSRLLDQALGA